ncbi:ABC transporter ATP-binding protein [Acinetobacter pittii]|uniref:ATP-binding cassette domain-containing protein n=1 Tax=Acinetobacter pittii TaxID=48296 RepID=UPI00197F3650|nr:ABC transporter ATP-binding protein [Acinetobacter pittii]MBN6530105.1 ABC transporter ATP-binding protein [Acinetobacter pittii]
MESIRIYKHIFKLSVLYYKSSKLHLTLMFLAIVFIGFLTTSLPYLMKVIVDTASESNVQFQLQNFVSFKNLYLLVVIYSSVWLLSQLIEWIKNIFSSYLSSSLESSIIIASLDNFLRIEKRLQDKIDIGVFNSDVSRASLSFSTLTSSFIVVIIPIIFQLLFITSILYLNVNIYYAVSFFVFTVLIFIFSNKLNKNSKKYFEPLYNTKNKLNSYFLEKISNSYEIKINNSIDFEINKFKDNSKEFINQTYTSNLKIGILMIYQILSIFLFLLLFLVVSIYLFSNNNITSGDLVMITSYIMMLTSPFLRISQQLMLISGQITSIEKLINYFNFNKYKLSNDKYDCSKELFRFSNCNLTIGGKTISDFNLSILSGRFYIIVGDSGIGKSTILNYMSGLYKINSGKLTYKNLDISDIFSSKIFNEVSFVSQNPLIFNGTLRENLIYNSPYSYTDDYLLDILEVFNLKNILDVNSISLNDNIDKIHKSFSGGEKQRLSIIRAFLKKPKLLVLDEPTSALDKYTALKVIEFLRSHVETLVVVSHSDYYLNIADEIINMNEKLKNSI